MPTKKIKRENTNRDNTIFGKKYKGWIIPLLTLLLISASCSLLTVKPVPEVTPSQIPPYISAEDAVSALNTANDKIETLKGFVKINTSDIEGKSTGSISGYLAIKNPDKVRFSYIGPFGVTLFEVVINGDDIVMYSLQDKVAYVGKIKNKNPGNTNSGVNIFSPDGLGNLFSRPSGDRFHIENLDDEIILYGIVDTESGPETIEKTVISRVDMRAESKERLLGGVAVSRTTYNEYQDIDGVPVPTKITIDDLKLGDSIKIAMSHISLNGTMSEDAFDTKVKEPWHIRGIEEFIPSGF
jgi:hypothetical protein